MLRVEQRSLQIAGTIVPSAFDIVAQPATSLRALRLRAPAERYAQDDTLTIVPLSMDREQAANAHAVGARPRHRDACYLTRR